METAGIAVIVGLATALGVVLTAVFTRRSSQESQDDLRDHTIYAAQDRIIQNQAAELIRVQAERNRAHLESLELYRRVNELVADLSTLRTFVQEEIVAATSTVNRDREEVLAQLTAPLTGDDRRIYERDG